MQKMLLSVPDALFFQIKSKMPKNQRSRIINGLIQDFFNKEKQELIQACKDLNENEELDKEMEEFRNSKSNFESDLNEAW